MAKTSPSLIPRYDTPSRLVLALGLTLGLVGIGYQLLHPEPMVIWLFEVALIVAPATIILYAGHWMATRPLSRDGRWIIAGGSLSGALLVDAFVGGYILTQYLSGVAVDEPGRLVLLGALGGSVVTLSTTVPIQKQHLGPDSTRSPRDTTASSGGETSTPTTFDTDGVTHVEFIGPPGAGKSTVHAKLTEDGRFFGGGTRDALQTILFEKTGRKHRALYRSMPSFVRSVFEDEFVLYRLKYRAISKFIDDHPDFPRLLSTARESVTYEPERIFPLCTPVAERYQMGVRAVSGDEILCLDEGFAQRAASILWRRPDGSFSIEEYFQAVPVPDVLIHVDAPIDLCMDRQHKRGRVVTAKEWEPYDPIELQKRHREICFLISDYLANQTTVITVENTDAVDDVVEQVRRSIWTSS